MTSELEPNFKHTKKIWVRAVQPKAWVGQPSKAPRILGTSGSATQPERFTCRQPPENQVRVIYPLVLDGSAASSHPVSKMIGCSFNHHLLFSSLPLRKSYEIKLEEFHYRDPLAGHPPTAKARGRPTTARASLKVRPAAPATGDDYGQKRRPRGYRLQRGARKGLPPATNTVARRGGDASRRSGRPLAGRLPTGKGSRRLCRGSGGSGGAKGERGVRASFGQKDDPTPMNSKNFEDCPRKPNPTALALIAPPLSSLHKRRLPLPVSAHYWETKLENHMHS
ncbi:hypothetical protein BHE74_00010592 [Ensete ventricosum]|nr:hypothetical protein BHE74_00010592 [Ensete ventricosum]